MTVIFTDKFGRPRPRLIASSEPSQSNPQLQNSLHLVEQIADVIEDVSCAHMLLSSLNCAAAKGAPLTELDIGNREIIVSLLQALIRTTARSAHQIDRHLCFALRTHLQAIEKENTCQS